MRKISTIILLLLAFQSVQAQPLPQDPEVRTGKLKNGMTYYIRHNAKKVDDANRRVIDHINQSKLSK